MSADDDTARGQNPATPFYDHPTGGWGSVKSVLRHLGTGNTSLAVLDTLWRQNKPRGHMCTSCAWAKPASPHLAEFCENGAKATIWDHTPTLCGPEFFASHTVSELRGWTDYELEKKGRLTHPMRYDAASDHYVAAEWSEAFASIGAKLRALDPKSTVFYASGRASLETSYLWALFARLYGHNNLPDSSNMCHETTSVALNEKIGTSVGTCILEDFETCDLLLFFGQNPGSNSPRLLHTLQEARKRGCKVITFNPLRERGLIEFINPQSPVEMITGASTGISDLYLQVKPGGDIAAIAGVAKALFAMAQTDTTLLDVGFMAQHTIGHEEFDGWVHSLGWSEIEETSGLLRSDLESVAGIYATAKRVIGVYGMGLTQHVHGAKSIGMLINLLLMRGNLGRPGAGICPVRGHSNVQGQRTVGISEKPELVPLDTLARQFGFEPPRDTGMTTIEVVQGLLDGRVKAFLSLGGNFARAIPDQGRADPAWSGLALNVQIATRLNRSHTLVGDGAWLLPCLVRGEEDHQSGGPQAVTIEDSLSHIHGSIGRRPPAADTLLSELSIIVGIAKAALSPNPAVQWDKWVGDYGLVRDLIAETYPELFTGFNDRMFQPGGFYKGNPVRDRVWKTTSGKAGFTTPTSLSALDSVPGSGVCSLITLRSNDQFNTTTYGFRDRLRGLKGNRNIVLMAPAGIAAAGLRAGQKVALLSTHADGYTRRLGGLTLTPYDLPDACVGAYYPEANVLVPLGLHDLDSKTPAYKGSPVRVVPDPS